MLPDEIEVEQVGACVTVRVGCAELTQAAFAAAVDEAAERMRYDNALLFVFDLEKVTFMPSSCLATLLTFRQEVEHCRGRIALVLKDGSLSTLLKITKLDEVFALFDDAQEAVVAMK